MSDEKRSDEVRTLLPKVVETMDKQATWMTPELRSHVMQSIEATRLLLFASLMRQQPNANPEHAEAAASEAALLGAFNIGLLIGEELEKLRIFREQMGDL